MRNRIFIMVLLAALVALFTSACGFVQKKSNRVIMETHWGGTETASVAEGQDAPAPAAPQEGEGAEPASTGQQGANTGMPAGAADDLTLYIAYQEITTAQIAGTNQSGTAAKQSRVRICNLTEDNKLKCAESEELNKMLNPHMHRE